MGREEGRGVYMHLECMAVLFMYQCDPGWDGDVPSVCDRCQEHGAVAEARRTQLLNGLYARQAADRPDCIHGKDGEGEDCHHVNCLKHRRQARLGST